jgi:hypothetical protein
MADDSSDPVLGALEAQGRVCAAFGSPFYGGLIDAAVADLGPSARALFQPWAGLAYAQLMEAAVTLRFLGALHDLALSGDDPALTAAFPPAGHDAAAAWRAARAAIERHGSRLAAFMAHEPQTNEVRRSACLLPGFLVIAAETGLPLRCLEAGASAGLNQLWHRFGYDLGAGGRWGDSSAPLQLDTEWQGLAPPMQAAVRVVETAACDRKPIDIADPAQRRRLKAYLWPDQTERIVRFDAAADMTAAAGVRVEAADAADWAGAHAAPKAGAATVFFHSIFWQYLPADTQAAIRAALERHGASATREAPLAWLRMEPPPGQLVPIELRLTLWPGARERRLAVVHAHGAKVAWEGADLTGES